MTTYSSTAPSKKADAVFKKHHVHEVVSSLAESKQIANDLSANKRYTYRMEVSVVGNVTIKPYDPIYLDGLPNGLSGYWTVLSVKHVFGGQPAKYFLDLEVGSDALGDTNPKAKSTAQTRDVQAELSGQSLSTPSQPVLNDYSVSPNSSSISTNYGLIPSTFATSPSVLQIPVGASKNIYAVKHPKFSSANKSVKWTASKGKGVTNV